MVGVYVLVLCTAVVCISGEAVQQPSCPSLIRPKRCSIGLSDQCTRDSDCTSFLRCCWDGCNRRCVDTSSSMEIHNMRSKYGVCERPKMDKCTAQFDLCSDDSYCVGAEKCCMDTDCGKKCMLPHLLQAIKNTSRAFHCPHVQPFDGDCSSNSKHQCSMDSECPTYTTCCFDGCIKRCTDKKGRMVVNTQGFLCPILPPPLACPSPYKECDVDNDCSVGMKCCSDSCNYWCMPSQQPPPVQSITPAPTKNTFVQNLHKPGKCPVLEKPKSCENQVFECNYDVDCWNSDRKCCDNGCVTVCVDPVAKTTSYDDLLTKKITKSTQKVLPKSTKTRTPKMEVKTDRMTTEFPSTNPSIKSDEPIEETIEKLDPTPRRNTVPTRRTQGTLDPWLTFPPIYRLPHKDGVRVLPSTFDAVTGQSIKILCTVKGEPFEGWYTPKGLKITGDDRMYVQGRGNHYILIIKNVEEMHGGKYTCRGGFSNAAHELNIKLFIDVPLEKQFLQAGTTGIVKVLAKGYPRPKSKWVKDGESISTLTGRYMISPSGSLIIKDVKPSDKGKYSIIANHYYLKSKPGLYSSMVGNSERADITVHVVKANCPIPTKILPCTINQKDQCADDDGCNRRSSCCSDGCRRICTATGNQDERHCPYLQPPIKCSSTFRECKSDDDCTENKKCCSDSCNFKCVGSSDTYESIPGVQTYPGVKGFCNPNQNTRLVCRVDKQPFEGWFDSYGRKVSSETHESRIMVENHGEYQVLVVKNVTAKDGGIYTCQGAIDSATLELEVNRTIDDYEHPILLYPGRSGILLQNIQCYPPPHFTWYKRGKPIDLFSNRYSISPSGSLAIRRIRSTDMGVYTLKFETGGKISDTGVKVAAAIDGVDFTEWQDSLSPGATVRCHKEVMYIDLDKKVLLGYKASELSLANTSCKATSNETHITLTSPLVGCGTETKFTKEAVVYSNLVQEYRKNNMITRIQDIRIPFSCFYTKEGVTSTFGLLPSRVRKVMDGGNVTTKFELGMSLFRDQSYSLSFGSGDFPLRVTVNRPLFVQVKIGSPDKRLTVMAERCYATPTQDPRHVMQYDIINDGCKSDPTVKFHMGPHTVQRFSFKAFQFLVKGKSFVYLHCQLVVCNVSDTQSRCAQGCIDSFSGRARRTVQQVSNEVELTQGPFILEKKQRSVLLQSDSFSKDYIWLMLGMAGFCVICLTIMVYLKKQIYNHKRLHQNQQQEDPDRETNV